MIEKQEINDCRREKKVYSYTDYKMAGRKLLIIGVMAVLACGVTTYGIVDYVNRRMTALSEEKVQKSLEGCYASKVEVTSFSREFSEREKEKYNKLYQAYKMGTTLPEGKISQIDYQDQAAGDKLYYIKSQAKFRLPNRQLSDEEILEYIDFNKRADDSISQQEVVKEINKKNQEGKETIRREMQKSLQGEKCMTRIVKKSEEEVYEISWPYSLQNMCAYRVNNMAGIEEERRSKTEFIEKRYKDNEKKIEVYEKIDEL